MRTTCVVVTVAVLLAGCASQSTAPEKIAIASAATKGPQCYSGDHGAFFDVEAKTSIAGVAVTCKPTADGKAAQWMGSTH